MGRVETVVHRALRTLDPPLDASHGFYLGLDRPGGPKSPLLPRPDRGLPYAEAHPATTRRESGRRGRGSLMGGGEEVAVNERYRAGPACSPASPPRAEGTPHARPATSTAGAWPRAKRGLRGPALTRRVIARHS